MAQKKEKTDGKNVAAGIGIAGALAAAAAGAYFLYGTKKGATQRRKIKSFALKAKGEVLEKLEKAKDVTEDSYKGIVTNVMKKYEKLKAEHGDEIELVGKELMNYWNHLKKESAPKKKKSSPKKKKA